MTRKEIIEGLLSIHAVTANYSGDQVILHNMPMPRLTAILYGAAELLEAETPRLLTAEDFDEGASVPCWKEPKSPTRRHGWAVIVYGKWLADRDVARYWTARPTDEQMEATPWPGA